jgi:LPS-assembly lipoprotein
MSWFDSLRIARPAQIVASLGFSVLLSGCFQPMYGGIAGGHLRDELAAIKVEPIPDRVGHYLGNELIFAFNGSGSEVPPKYKLTISIRERVQTPLVDTLSGRATAGTVVIDAIYKVTSLADSHVVTEGTAFTAASYDRTSQRFADMRAARDAEIRDAKTLADQIQTRIAAAMSTL